MEYNGFDKVIVKQYQGLLKDCKSISSRDEISMIRKSFQIANKLCENKELRWGEPIILHTLRISRIAAKEIGLSTTSIIAIMMMEFADRKSVV